MQFATKESLGFLVVLLFTIEASAQTLGFFRCPDVGIQPNFNYTDFARRWFEYSRTPRIQEDLGKCIFFEYIPPKNGRIIINRRKVSIITNMEDLHSATATVTAPGEAVSIDNYDYRVVSTDYKNYAVIYACKNESFGLYHSDVLWILTREPVPSEEYVQMAYKAVENNGLSTVGLRKVDQKNCPKPSEKELPTNL